MRTESSGWSVGVTKLNYFRSHARRTSARNNRNLPPPPSLLVCMIFSKWVHYLAMAETAVHVSSSRLVRTRFFPSTRVALRRAQSQQISQNREITWFWQAVSSAPLVRSSPKKYVETRHTSNKHGSRADTVLRKRRPRNRCSKFGLLEKIQCFPMLRLSVGNQQFRKTTKPIFPSQTIFHGRSLCCFQGESAVRKLVAKQMLQGQRAHYSTYLVVLPRGKQVQLKTKSERRKTKNCGLRLS